MIKLLYRFIELSAIKVLAMIVVVVVVVVCVVAIKVACANALDHTTRCAPIRPKRLGDFPAPVSPPSGFWAN